ncbi:MAG: alpha/beta hydrolase-fold protein [Anaerolineae bacterium]
MTFSKHARWLIPLIAVVVAAATIFTVIFASPSSAARLTEGSTEYIPELGWAETLSDVSRLSVETHVFHSETLNRDTPYYVYLPPDYQTHPNQRYPVLYMLHGMSGTNAEWLQYGLLRSADQMMRAGQIRPFIIVLPQGDKEYWVDHANNGPRWGTYVTHDVVAEIDGHYRTLADRPHRAIGGLSMGGHGAMQLAINSPDLFAVVGAHSPALRTYENTFAFFGDRAYFDAHNPLALCKKYPKVVSRFKLWVDIGREDPWAGAAEAFHEQLVQLGIPHTWNEYAGGHSGDYWGNHAAEYLQFYSDSFAD